jgi:hypothetical protein
MFTKIKNVLPSAKEKCFYLEDAGGMLNYECFYTEDGECIVESPV